jgi:hypothetical protein
MKSFGRPAKVSFVFWSPKIWLFPMSENIRRGSHAGIMVVRLGDDSRENLIRSVEQAWQGPEASKFASALVVVTEVKVRIRQRVDGDLAV